MASPLSMLAPRTLIPNGEGFGGFAKIEQGDVAYALSGLVDGQAAFLRAVYALDHGTANMRALYLWAWQQAISVAVDRGWQSPKGSELLKSLSERAVAEIVYPQLTMCAHCRGAKSVQPNQHNPSGDCKPCGNTGQANPSDSDMAGYFGMPESEWKASWLPRYAVIFAKLLELKSDGLRHVNSRLREKRH